MKALRDRIYEASTLKDLASLEEEMKQTKDDDTERLFNAILKGLKATQKALEATQKAKRGGTYFRITSTIWNSDSRENFTTDGKATYDKIFNIRNSKPPSYANRCKSHVYGQEEEDVDKSKYYIFDGKRGVDDLKNAFKGLKDMNIFGTDTEKKKSEWAHIIPKDLACSAFHGPLGPLLTGFSAENAKECFSIIHGYSNSLDFHSYSHRGFKNVESNFIKLPNCHAQFFDGGNAHRLILLPIIPLDRTNMKPDWSYDGEYDEILVVPHDEETHRWIYNDGKFIEPEYIQEATDDDVEEATILLKECVKLLAYLLLDKEKGPIADAEVLMNDDRFNKLFRGWQNPNKDSANDDTNSRGSGLSGSTKHYKNLERNLENLNNVANRLLENESTVAVPTLTNGDSVMKINLSDFRAKYPLPDWLALALRGGINFSQWTNEQLLPACQEDPWICDGDSVVSALGYASSVSSAEGMADTPSPQTKIPEVVIVTP